MTETLLGSPAGVALVRPSAVVTVLPGLLLGMIAGLVVLPGGAGGDAGARANPRGAAPRAPGRFRLRRLFRGPSTPPHARASSGAAHEVVPDAALLVDLVSSLLAAGSGIEASLDRLARTVPGAAPLRTVHRALAAGADWDDAWAELRRQSARRRRRVRGSLRELGRGLLGGRGRQDARLEALCDLGEQLTFAHGTGAPSTELLQIGAARLRAARRHSAERQVARLGVRMVLPLGLCFLPAFILLGVMPVVLGLLPRVIDGALG